MQGPYGQSYLPMADLQLLFDHSAQADTYERWLDLDSAIAGVRYTLGGATFTREVFASAPDQAIIVRLACDQPGAISFTAALESQLRHTVASSPTQLDLTGRAPRHVAPSYYQVAEPIIYDEGQDGDGMRFAACLKATVAGGRVSVADAGLRVESADSVILCLAAATSFGGYDQVPGRTKIDIAWEDGKLQQATIRSERGGMCRVRTTVPVAVMAGAAAIAVARPEPKVVMFECTAGERYELMPSAT